MNRIGRFVWVLATARARGPLAITDVGRLPLRVLPNDIDLAWHMNNGVYPTMMDLGRVDLMIRAGWWRRLLQTRTMPVIMQETVTFRRSLRLGERYVLETRAVGWDAVSVVHEQRFVVDGEIAAQALVRMRFLQRGRGVDAARLWQLLQVDPPPSALPGWVAGWAEGTRLPSPRTPTPPGEPPFWPAGPAEAYSARPAAALSSPPSTAMSAGSPSGVG